MILQGSRKTKGKEDLSGMRNMFYQKLMDEFVAVTKEIIGERLTGIYLHGSLAMGCFNPEKSDIDLIVIIEDDISDSQKMEFMKLVVGLNQQAPAKGLEISIVKRSYCKPFVYPTPFELHFSPMHLQWFSDNPQNYVENMRGEDKDLAAHVTIINKYGIVLCGEARDKVFADVPQENFVDSICSDMETAEEDIIEQPIYIILNLCRVLAFLKEGRYLSKEQAGKWGLEYLPSNYHPLISEALTCYATDKNMVVENSAADLFVRGIRKLIEEGKYEIL